MTKAIICGGRDFTQWETLKDQLDRFHETDPKGPITCVVHGGASGADKLAGRWAALRNVPCVVVSADWAHHGKSAGPRRNQAMAEAGIDIVIAFPGGKGTADMISRARRAGIEVRQLCGKTIH